MEPWRALHTHNGGLEAQMEAWRVWRPVVADSHHFYEEQDPDPHQSEKLDPDPHWGEKLDPDPHWSDADPQPSIKHDCFTLQRIHMLFSQATALSERVLCLGLSQMVSSFAGCSILWLLLGLIFIFVTCENLFCAPNLFIRNSQLKNFQEIFA